MIENKNAYISSMKRFEKYLILFLFSTCTLFAQVDTPPEGTSSWGGDPHIGVFLTELGYLQVLTSNIADGQGLTFTIGYNPANHFNAKTAIAPFAGIDVFWGGSYQKDFTQAVNNHYDSPADEIRDEAAPCGDPGQVQPDNCYELNEEIQSLERGEYLFSVIREGHLEGSGALNFGLYLKPPINWFPLVKYYFSYGWIGVVSSNGYVNRVYSDGTSTGGRLQNYNFSGWGAEIIPLKKQYFVGPGLGNLIPVSLSLFFQSYELEKAKFHEDDGGNTTLRELQFNEFVSNQFWKDYKQFFRFGIKISAGIF